jgi:hypothetical protein
MITWGTLATQLPDPEIPRAAGLKAWGLSLIGAVVALGVFMADTFRVAGSGLDAIRNALPSTFPWPLFSIALCLMSAPVVQLWRQTRTREPRASLAAEIS